MFDSLMDWLVFLGGICFMVVPLFMLIVAYFYVNHTKRKVRLVELGYGLNNKWARGKRIDIVDSTMLFAQMPFAAKAMKLGRKIHGGKLLGYVLAPNLIHDQNYLKIWQEFRFYCIWTTSCLLIGFLGAICLFVGIGIDKGWF
jgi:hypothetical protein